MNFIFANIISVEESTHILVTNSLRCASGKKRKLVFYETYNLISLQLIAFYRVSLQIFLIIVWVETSFEKRKMLVEFSSVDSDSFTLLVLLLLWS